MQAPRPLRPAGRRRAGTANASAGRSCGTREYGSVVRQVWAQERPLEHRGEHDEIPYRGPGATGLGKPLRSILHGRQIPIYLAAIGPKNVTLAAEIADGGLPVWSTTYRAHVWPDALETGFRRADGGRSLASFDIAPTVTVIQGDDVAACLELVKPTLALYSPYTLAPAASYESTASANAGHLTRILRRRGRLRG